MGEYTFVVEKVCPICEQRTRVVKTKSRLSIIKTDEDFCVHYANFNPYYYRIWFCEHCGYAADEQTFLSKMPDRKKAILGEFLSKRRLAMQFTENRGLPEAIASYQLALHYLQMTNESPSKQAGRWLEMAWIYRSSGEQEKEEECMHKAADFYDLSLVTEHYPIGKVTDTRVLYLVGAIYYRLGDADKCTQYLSRIIGDQKIRWQEPKIFDQARELWQTLRSQGKEEQKPEEPKKKTAVRRRG